MVYVIEVLVDGNWEHARHPDGQPMWFHGRVECEREMSKLKNNNRRKHFRWQHVKD